MIRDLICDLRMVVGGLLLSEGSLPADNHESQIIYGSTLVQGRGHLRSARALVLRQQQRRYRRLPRSHPEAAVPAGSRGHVRVAAAVLPVAAQGRWVRYRGLHV